MQTSEPLLDLLSSWDSSAQKTTRPVFPVEDQLLEPIKPTESAEPVPLVEHVPLAPVENNREKPLRPFFEKSGAMPDMSGVTASDSNTLKSKYEPLRHMDKEPVPLDTHLPPLPQEQPEAMAVAPQPATDMHEEQNRNTAVRQDQGLPTPVEY